MDIQWRIQLSSPNPVLKITAEDIEEAETFEEAKEIVAELLEVSAEEHARPYAHNLDELDLWIRETLGARVKG